MEEGPKQVDENGYIEHQVDFCAKLSENENDISWEDEDSYDCYGEEFANLDDSDYYDQIKADGDLDDLDILKSEVDEFDINGDPIPKEVEPEQL